MDIIYCAGGNSKLAEIAIDEGFLYGARSDDIRQLHCNGLIDINWKNYDWDSHILAVKYHNPLYAVVPDIINSKDLDKTLLQIHEIKRYCDRVIVVPKIQNIIRFFPSDVVIGVSVPTSYAGFLPDMTELRHHDVHLLGGSPGQQRDLWISYESNDIRVVSVDCNSHSKVSDFGSFWDGQKWSKMEDKYIGKYEAFRLSCKGIIKMWEKLGAI